MKNVKAGHAKPIVCLDAGHYGKYNRSPAVPEYYESDMNWKLHLLLKAELEKYGIEVRTTRARKDTDLAPVSRGKASANCDLFISLHSNASTSEAVKYVAAMYQVDDHCGETDGQSKKFALILAEAVANAMALPYQIWSRESSKDRDGNGYNDDYYGVLRGAHAVQTPGIILEHGFHTHADTARWLLADANLEHLAKVEARTIAAWFHVEAQDATFALSLKVLQKGSRGEQVKAMQMLLIAEGFSCGVCGSDSSFGKETESAVKRYQQHKGLAQNGIADQNVWKHLLGTA